MIVKGQIEIKTSVDLIKEGNRVTPSQAALLVKLSLRPFKYGLTVLHVYDEGTFFEAKILDLNETDLIRDFQQGIKNIAAISLRVGHPTLASIPHSVVFGYKKIFSISLATSYVIKGTAQIKKLLEDPEALAAALAASAAPSNVVGQHSAPKVEEAKEEAEKEEEEEDMGAGGLFGDDEEW